MSRELQHKHTMDQFKEVCNGTNCRASKAMPYHSEECRAEHDALHENRRASPASVPEVTDGMAYAFHHALTDHSIGQEDLDEIKTGLRAALAAAPTPPVSEDRKDAERWRWITRDGRTRELRIPAKENKASIDAAIDGAIIRARAAELEKNNG